MSAIYEENKDEDGFLYMTYSGENTFGLLWVAPRRIAVDRRRTMPLLL
jgi:hypothetical protein